jgi:hypothetical protein
MFSPQGLSVSPDVLILVTPIAVLSLTLGFLYFIKPRRWKSRLFDTVSGITAGMPRRTWQVAAVGIISTLVGVAVTFVTTSSPFIYFQF